MYGIRFSFVSTRSGLTRVRHYDAENEVIKNEALAFARKHARAIDETYYSRTVDYNMLVNDSATLIQVPFNTHEKLRDQLAIIDSMDELSFDPASSVNTPIRVRDMTLIEKLELLSNSSIHAIATQSIIVNEGTQRGVAGVTGAFYNYASFVMRFFNSTNTRFNDGSPRTKPAFCYTGNSSDEACSDSRELRCGYSNDTIDCLLVDNNGYIVVSEDLDYIGKHLKAYDPTIMTKLVRAEVFHEINITDYQSICIRQEEKQQTSAGFSSIRPYKLVSTIGSLANNLVTSLTYIWIIATTLSSNLFSDSANAQNSPLLTKQQLALQPMLSLLPNKTYLRPCEKIVTLYETRAGSFIQNSAEYYTTRCGCETWFVYEQVPKTNLFMLIVDSTAACRQGCVTTGLVDPTDPIEAELPDTERQQSQVCSMLERESELYRKKLDSCFSHHPDEENIKLCGSAGRSTPLSKLTLFIIIYVFIMIQGCILKAPSNLIISPFSIGFSMIVCTKCPYSRGSPRRAGQGTVEASCARTLSGKP